MATRESDGSDAREQYVHHRYRVVRQLGVGGMGTVYLVEDTLDEGRRLALKTLRTGAGSRYASSAFRQEFEAMTQLHHPNVVEVYDFGQLNEQEDFFTMEVVEGRSLLHATAEAPLSEILDYALQIGRALAYIHSQGLIHFDLKPDNIMVRRDGTVKVMDFGLVEDVAALQQGTVKGSVHYLAPEMIRGEAIDHRFDLYSLGAVLFHVIAGRPLYEGPGPQVLHHHVNGEPDFERDVRRPFPPPLRSLLSRLLAKEPSARLASAAELVAELERIAGVPGAVAARREAGERHALGSRFVGREAELHHFKAAFAQRVEAVVAGAPPLQLVAGPAGIGRSRLVQELRHYVQVRGVRFAHGSSLEDSGLPGQTFSEVLRALVREILPPTGGEELASFRDALVVPWTDPSLGASLDPHGGHADGHGDTMATLAPGERPPRPMAASERDTVTREVVVGPEARRPERDTLAESSSLNVLWAAREQPGPALSEAALCERAARVHHALLDVLRPAAPALARLLPDQPALRTLGGDAPRFTDARAEREWLVDTLARFLVDAARVRPLVLYLSDLQWADALSLELLGRLARRLADAGHDATIERTGDDFDDERTLVPDGSAAAVARAPSRFLLLGCFRDDESPVASPLRRAVAEWTDGGLAQLTLLRPLDAEGLRHMLQSMTGEAHLPAEVARRILERTGGNPFRIEATVRALLARGALRPNAPASEASSAPEARPEPAILAAWDAWDTDTTAAPLGSLDGALDQMIRQLAPDERAALELLAVFNRPTSALSLELAAPQLEPLPPLLSALVRKRLLLRGWAEGHYHYRLRHNQLRAHLYRALAPAEQARLHAAAGRALERRHGGNERFFEDIARHFQLAGDAEKAARYARAAAAASAAAATTATPPTSR